MQQQKAYTADESKWQYRSILPIFLKIFIPLIVIIGSLTVYNIVNEVSYERTSIIAELSQQAHLSTRSIQRDITDVVRILKYLATSADLKQYKKNGSPEEKKHVLANLVHFAQQMPYFDQIRWLDNSGMERLRVDYRNGTASIVPDAQLQDKSGRYYFLDAITMPPGSVFISPLDLNIEGGAVEVPFRPTLRFAITTSDDDNNTSGLFVLNYRAEILLQHFADRFNAENTHISLLNDDGYWLYSSAGEPTWGFMLGDKERFVDRHPEVWREIERQPVGLVEDLNTLYYFETIDITDSIFDPRSHGEPMDSVRIQAQHPRLTVVSSYSGTTPIGIKRGVFWYIGLIMMLVGVMLFLSWRVACADVGKSNALAEAALHAKVMENATNGIVITDTRDHIISINSAFVRLTGYGADEIIGKSPSMIASGRHGNKYFIDMQSTLKESGYWEGEMWNRHKSGETYPEWVSVSAVLERNGLTTNYIWIFSTLAEHQQTTELLRKMANSDPLTGLVNRTLLTDRIEQAMVAAQRAKHKVALLFLDLDGFKLINDTLGHDVGDVVLQHVAQKLRGCVRASDTVSRFGGDEFVVLLSEIKHANEVSVVADKIIELISAPEQINGATCMVGVSIGISIYPDDAEIPDMLLKHADKAMYEAKSRGRGCYRFSADVGVVSGKQVAG